MTTGEIVAFVLVALIVAVTVFGRDIVQTVRNRGRSGYGSAYTKEQIAEFEERNRIWRKEFEARNPDGPPISDEEHAEFKDWLEQQSRAAIRLTPTSGIETGSDGSRLGGPVALAEGQTWPVSKRGAPMELLAQLDFAELPALDGFPTKGVLQFFIPQDDDMMGMGDEADEGDVAVLYRPNGAGEELVPTPLVPLEESVSPFLNQDFQRDGVALSGEAFVDPIGTENWEVDAKLDGNILRPGFDRWEKLLEVQANGKPLIHHAGGYPVFVQWDFRKPGEFDDYDTVLLRLTSDKCVQWGDVGEANFLIRGEDLAKLDFSRVIFWWDCS